MPARIMIRDRLIVARKALRQFWSSIRTFNVVFTPGPAVQATSLVPGETDDYCVRTWPAPAKP
jgi:hypothetical protein